MVAGGFEYDHSPIAQLDEEELTKVAEEISQSKPPVSNVAVCGIFSTLDNSTSVNQEDYAASFIQSKCPEISCTSSHNIGLIGLLERENRAIINEALKPYAEQTVKYISQALLSVGLCCPSFLTRNDGTMLRMEEAVKYPVLTFSARSTNSFQGAAFLSGLNDAITVDIGGTYTNIGMIKNGSPAEVFTQSKIGGVRTNLTRMDTFSQEIGGGSTCSWSNSSLILGKSVGRELSSKAMCFGGDTCTATDVAVSAGLAPLSICQVPFSGLESLSPMQVYKTLSYIRRTVESGIDRVKRDEVDVPVILVGGGNCLLDKSSNIKGSSSVITPKKYGDVAGAIGAALAMIGATVDIIETKPSDETKKEQLLEQVRNRAISAVVKKGAIPSKVCIHREEVVSSSKRICIHMRAIGPLEESGRDEEIEAKDNPHWPFASEEDKTKDKSAGLSIPLIEGERWLLSADDLQCIEVGAGIMGCGGGGDPHIGHLLARRKLAQGKSITVINPFRLKESDVGLVTFTALMGAPLVILEKLLTENETPLALDAIQRVVASGIYDNDEGWEEGGRKGNEHLGVIEHDLGGGRRAYIAEPDDLRSIDLGSIEKSKRITHLMSFEIGGVNTLQPLVLGADLDLPVLDADGSGRSFPELQMCCPFIYGCPPYPTAVAGSKVTTCTAANSAKDLEDFLRETCVKMGMLNGICSSVLTLQDVRSKAVLLSVSKAWQLGRAIKRAQLSQVDVLETIVEQQNGMILIAGKVVDLAHVTEAGFGRLEAVVEGTANYQGHKIKVLAKNENYIVRYVEEGKDGAVMAVTPDLICVVHSDTGLPVTSEKMSVGLKVGVLVLPANPRLLTSTALRVVGPAAFGLNGITYHPPLSLKQIGKIH